MKKSQELMSKANIIPYIKLAVQKEGGGVEGTGPHKVKLIEDKIITGNEYPSGKEVPMVRYILEENGEQKKYDVQVKDKTGDLHYLIQRMAEIEEGTEIILEYQRKGLKGFISVKLPGAEVKDEEIPTIQEGEEDINVKDIPF